jgi:hypothetical protein
VMCSDFLLIMNRLIRFMADLFDETFDFFAYA